MANLNKVKSVKKTVPTRVKKTKPASANRGSEKALRDLSKAIQGDFANQIAIAAFAKSRGVSHKASNDQIEKLSSVVHKRFTFLSQKIQERLESNDKWKDMLDNNKNSGNELSQFVKQQITDAEKIIKRFNLS